MSDLYSIDEGGGSWFNLAAEYDSPAEAETAATEIGHAGTAVLRSAYLAAPQQVAVALAASKVNKIKELTTEGDLRCHALSPLFSSVLHATATGWAIKPSSFEAIGVQYVAVGAAYALAVAEILALPDEAAVDAYNVVTDPGWP